MSVSSLKMLGLSLPFRPSVQIQVAIRIYKYTCRVCAFSVRARWWNVWNWKSSNWWIIQGHWHEQNTYHAGWQPGVGPSHSPHLSWSTTTHVYTHTQTHTQTDTHTHTHIQTQTYTLTPSPLQAKNVIRDYTSSNLQVLSDVRICGFGCRFVDVCVNVCGSVCRLSLWWMIHTNKWHLLNSKVKTRKLLPIKIPLLLSS